MIFKGIATALITPFKNGKVDVEAFQKILDYQYDNGVDAVVVLGTTGEPATMSQEEKDLVITLAVKRLKGKIPIIVGAGSNCTESAIRACKNAEKLGADGLLVVTPYYNKCTQEGLVAHYGEIAKSTILPIICYNVPSRTGVNMLPQTFAKLASEYDNIVAVKEASGNMEQIEQYLRLVRGKAHVYSGDDALTVPITAMGGSGVISVASNVFPAYFAKTAHLALDGDIKQASKMQLDALPLISALFCEVNPIPVKKAMEIRGYCEGELRLPLTDMTDENAKKLQNILKCFPL